jgi:hypothetical protein
MNDNNALIELLETYLKDVDNPILNFKLARHYDEMDHSASAVSYYLRTAERTDDKVLQYSALIGAANCYEREGFRNFTVKSIMRNALLIDMERPEGYLYLAQHNEKMARNITDKAESIKHWNDCYFYASLGAKFATKNVPRLYLPTKYPGYYSLLFMKAMSAWWCGLCQESKDLFDKLMKEYSSSMDPSYIAAVKNNLDFFEKMRAEKQPK